MSRFYEEFPVLTDEEKIFYFQAVAARQRWHPQQTRVCGSALLHGAIVLFVLWPGAESAVPLIRERRPVLIVFAPPPPDTEKRRKPQTETPAVPTSLPPPPSQPQPTPPAPAEETGLALSFDDDSVTRQMLPVLEQYKARIAFVEPADYERNRRKPDPDEEPVGLLATHVFDAPGWNLEPGPPGVKYQISGYDRVLLRSPEKSVLIASLLRRHGLSAGDRLVMLVFEPGEDGFYWQLENKLLNQLRAKGIAVQRSEIMKAVASVRLAWSLADSGAKVLDWQPRAPARTGAADR